MISDSSDDEPTLKKPSFLIRLSSYNYRLNHKELKRQHGSKEIKVAVLTKAGDKRLLSLPMPTRDFTVRDLLEAGNIPFNSRDYMHCEDIFSDGNEFNFIVVLLPEGSDKGYADFKVRKFKEKEEKSPTSHCKYCFLLRDEGVKCGRCVKKSNDEENKYIDNEKLLALAKMINDFTVKSEFKEEDKKPKMMKGFSKSEKKRRY
uniref:Uncharacterized protein n=1 Tax=Megaselia scalaris TaxID=36166 RepID=T1GDT9_MEGSC